MCGLAGIISFKEGRKVDQQMLGRINQRMFSRGPDNSGFWYSQNQHVGLAHNRLSFIDLHERSSQPFAYQNSRYIIAYVGELYNYQELKKNLISRGYNFLTTSDTEVMVAMYACFGQAMLRKLRGMFTFAIWDNHEHELFVARDPFGVKPFYYYQDNQQLIFASQVKAISAEASLKLESDAAGWCGFFKYGSVPDPWTTYKQIKALPAGSYMKVNQSGELKITSYYSIYEEYLNIESSQSTNYDKIEQLPQIISESVDYHLISDVPLSLFLSAGVDSTVLANYLKGNVGSDFLAVTLDFAEFNKGIGESEVAVKTAAAYGLRHKCVSYNQADFTENIDQFFIAMDQPSIDGLNTWMTSKAVSDAGYRAALSGLGADEILAGYPSFIDVPKYAGIIERLDRSSWLKKAINYAAHLYPINEYVHPKLKGFCAASPDKWLHAYQLKRCLFLDDELTDFFDHSFLSQGFEQLATHDEVVIKNISQLSNDYLKVSALEIDLYMKNQLLRDADWASMCHSLEIRVPFVDVKLISSVASILSRQVSPRKLPILSQVMGNTLPEAVLNRSKTGFETPVKDWLQVHPDIANWQTQPILTKANCPWARRWAYEVKSRFIL